MISDFKYISLGVFQKLKRYSIDGGEKGGHVRQFLPLCGISDTARQEIEAKRRSPGVDTISALYHMYAITKKLDLIESLVTLI